ncbi:MAG TPA: 3-phosphoshikimate 1-carboxyvinyltransferase [Chitinophagaceae bacterium]|jgi:3-phosphoshikimate 1-carboxyvinyltransferase|nr:3-phosphoshikimate 1-carboxyvinyltransferase [Chitinophagaceae bacterium]
MKALLHPSELKGSLFAPASKSAMQRACAAALVRRGVSVLRNPGISNDDRAALSIIRQLGAEWTEEEGTITVRSNGVRPAGDFIDCHESGLSIRMFTSIAALSEQRIDVRGSGSLSKRPMHFFDDVLPRLGVTVESKDGFLPLSVQGPLQAANITVDGSLSSQYLTGLLFAYAAAEAHDVTITVENLNSRPYIDLTLHILRSFGLPVPENRNFEQFYFSRSALSQPESISYTVEGDWSNAAFLLVGGAIAGDLHLKGMDLQSVQGDKAILEVLRRAAARLEERNEGLQIRRSELTAFEFDATDCPDLFPPLVALAAHSKGTSRIRGVHRLTHKESDRAATLQEEFGKLQVPVTFEDDVMLVQGTGSIQPAEVSSHNDHRIAMATAVAGLGGHAPLTITGAEAVNKSYPQFWNDIRKLGAQLSLTDN